MEAGAGRQLTRTRKSAVVLVVDIRRLLAQYRPAERFCVVSAARPTSMFITNGKRNASRGGIGFKSHYGDD